MPFLHETTLNLDTGKATRASVLPASSRSSLLGVEFPQVPQSLVGRKTRFGYCCGVGDKGDFSHEVKFDLQVRVRGASKGTYMCSGEGELPALT